MRLLCPFPEHYLFRRTKTTTERDLETPQYPYSISLALPYGPCPPMAHNPEDNKISSIASSSTRTR